MKTVFSLWIQQFLSIHFPDSHEIWIQFNHTILIMEQEKKENMKKARRANECDDKENGKKDTSCHG